MNNGQEAVIRESVYLKDDVNFSVMRNITAEKKYQDFMVLLKMMLDSFSESLALVNITTKKYLYVNKARESLYARKVEDVLNNDINFWYDHCVHSDGKEIMAYLLSVANEDEPLLHKFWIVAPSGKVRYVLEKTTIRKINGQVHTIKKHFFG